MTQQSILSISDFSLMTELPVQTLRYYHQQGLLVPAVIKESGYRGYTFDQTHQAFLILALRRASMSIEEIKSVLNAPGTLSQSLASHQEALTQKRAAEDQAIAQAQRLAQGWPNIEMRTSPALTAVTKRAPSVQNGFGNEVLPGRVIEAAHELQQRLINAGVTCGGSVWCQLETQAAEAPKSPKAAKELNWLIAADVSESREIQDLLPANVSIEKIPSNREFVALLPPTPTPVAFAAAVEYLTKTILAEDLVPQFERLRYLLTPDGIELAIPVSAL